jgi:hypothetical protein
VDEHEIQSVHGRDGSHPEAQLKVPQLRGERVAEEPYDLATGRQRELERQQEGVAECGSIHYSIARGELYEQLPSLGVGGVAATVAT